MTSLALQADGKILVGGSFTKLAGQTRNFIGRLNADGTLDLGFIPPGADGRVISLAVQADGKILVGRMFANLGGQPRNLIGRLNADGTLDQGFNPGPGKDWGGPSGVWSLAMQANGKILVGGWFTALGGQGRTNIARLNADGTLDLGFNPGAEGGGNTIDSCDPPVASLAVQADGKILVGGNFTQLCGQPRSSIARLNADGTLDQGFNASATGGYSTGGPNWPGAISPTVESLVVQADGKILVGGKFKWLCGQTCSNFGRLNADGTLDRGSNLMTFAGGPSVALQADGQILLYGGCRLNNNEPATQSMTFDGSTATWLRSGTSPEVWRTTFDYSSNNVIWTSLGIGSRIVDGWQLSSLSLPPGGRIRARGYVTGGQFNGSGWFVETLLKLDNGTLQRPRLSIISTGGRPTLQVTGKVGESYTIEYASALPANGNWLNLSSLVLTNSPQVIVDNTFIGAAQRFYRARSGP